MIREDLIWILPSALIAIVQLVYIWPRLPSQNKKDMEISGKYGQYELIWFRNAKFATYLIFIYQLFAILYPISSEQNVIWIIRVFGYLFVISGFFLSFRALNDLGKNWQGMMEYGIKRGQFLQTRGIYGYIRHPIYLAVILEMTGYELIVNSWLFIFFAVIPLVVFVLHIQNEDYLLKQKYGKSYIDYKSKTKAFIPYIY